ncbi:hypothetical protein Dalk_3950 [Desulfatibacillum aliphaticivorans]|uniref:Uncharacterized protein n=1 Tax=Desulfatibacillum aliphaticivorans TaxID=218208 RepID=B8FJG7_DESAL|nr:hypothetical protein Dalk_3950 [Desulfatibacillum aliphaticivorans]
MQHYSGNIFFVDLIKGGICYWTSQYKDALYKVSNKSYICRNLVKKMTNFVLKGT